MKVSYLKLSLGVVFILCLFTGLEICQAEVVWSEDFNDGNLEDWDIRGNWSATNNYAQAYYDPELGDPYNMYHDCRLRYSSQIAYGTWSFDLFLKENKYILFSFLGSGSSEFEEGWNDYYFEIKPIKQNSGFYLGKNINTQYKLLSQRIIQKDLTDQWTHIDITRANIGRIYIYRDGELVLKLMNNENQISEWFGVYSDPDGTYIDNITVSNTVDVTHQASLDIVLEYDGEAVSQGDTVVLQIQVRDDVRYHVEEAVVEVQVGEQEYIASEIEPGLYQINIDTSDLEGDIDVMVTAEKNGYLPTTETFEIQVQETSSLFEYGPYKVSWVNLFNVTGNPMRISIYYPSIEDGENSQPNIVQGPYATLLVSPGIGRLIGSLTQLAERTCSWGYVPVIVESRAGALDFERMNDIIEILDWLSEQNNDPSFSLYQMVDEDNIGVMGHSMGANAAILSCVNETRFKVSVPIASALKSHYRVRAETSSEVNVPILFIYGSVDPWAVDNAPLMYESANSPKFIVNVDSLDHGSILQESTPFKYITSFLKVYLNGDEEYIPHLYGEYAQQDIDEGLIELTYDISEGKAEFEVSNLVIEPASVKVGQSVTISVDVMNTGTKSGKHTVSFVIDGISEDEQEIFLDVDQSEALSFMVEDGVEGSYPVDVNGLTGSYEVTKPIIPGYPLWSIGVAILLISLILYMKQSQ